MRELLVVVAGRLLAIVVAFAAMRLSTRLLSPSEYGELSLFLAVQLLAVFFLTNPLVQYLNRNLHAWNEAGTLMPRLRLYFVYVLACALLSAIVFLVRAMLTSPGDEGPRLEAALFVFLGVVAVAWGPVLASFLNLLGHRLLSVGLAGGASLLSLLIAAFLALLSPTGLNWFSGGALGGVLVGAISYAVLRKEAIQGSQALFMAFCDRATVLEFCLPLAVSAAFMWFLVSGYRLEVAGFWSKADLGYMAVGLGVATQVWAVIESTCMQYLHPYLYKRLAVPDEIENARACTDYVNLVGPIYLGFSAFVAANQQVIYGILVSGPFRNALEIFRIGIYIELFRVLANAFSIPAHARRDARALIPSYFSAAVIVGAGIFLAARMGGGITAACMVIMAGAALLLGIVIFAMNRLVRFEIDYVRWSVGVLILLAGYVTGCMDWGGDQLATSRRIMVILGSAAAVSAYFLGIMVRNSAWLRFFRPVT